MNEVFVIERMVAIGVWELFSTIFFTEELDALDKCLAINAKMQERDKSFCARVTKLTKG